MSEAIFYYSYLLITTICNYNFPIIIVQAYFDFSQETLHPGLFPVIVDQASL